MCCFIIISSHGPNSLIQIYNKQWGQFTSNTKSSIAASQTNFHDYQNQWESASTWASASMRIMAQPHESVQWGYHFSKEKPPKIEQHMQHINKHNQGIAKKRKNPTHQGGHHAFAFIKLAQRMMVLSYSNLCSTPKKKSPFHCHHLTAKWGLKQIFTTLKENNKE